MALSRVTPFGWIEESGAQSYVTPFGWIEESQAASGGASSTAVNATTGSALGTITTKPLPKSTIAATTGVTIGAISSISGASSTAINAATGAAVGTITSVGDTSSGTFTSEPLRDNVGALVASKALNYVALYNDTTGALVVRKTGLSTNPSGVFSFSDASITSGEFYRVDWEDIDGKRRMPRKAAS